MRPPTVAAKPKPVLRGEGELVELPLPLLILSLDVFCRIGH
jgi:hypothetical protein